MSANAYKKRLKVASLASLPVACSQAALALLTHCLSCSMARRTDSSSELSMIGFRPRPERVTRTCDQAVDTFHHVSLHPGVHGYKTHVRLCAGLG